MNRYKLLILTVFLSLIVRIAPKAYANPPPWVPAHG